MTFEEIVAGVETPIVYLAPFEVEEAFIRCHDCGRLVRARQTALQLHEQVTCELYRAAPTGVGDRVNEYLRGMRESGL